jgi:hypothetical protein
VDDSLPDNIDNTAEQEIAAEMQEIGKEEAQTSSAIES